MTRISKQEVMSIAGSHYRVLLKEVMLKIAEFEERYRCSFPDFEKKLQNSREEYFEDWDNYMEWKANFNVCKELLTPLTPYPRAALNSSGQSGGALQSPGWRFGPQRKKTLRITSWG